MEAKYIFISLAVLLFFYLLVKIKKVSNNANILEFYRSDLQPAKQEDENQYAAESSGEAESILYTDGSSRFILRVYGTDLPRGSFIRLFISGYMVREIKTSGGTFYYDTGKSRVSGIPHVREDEHIELKYEGNTILQGHFRKI